MELLYRVNEKDNVLGSVERGRAHEDAVLHRAGIVFLARSDGKILLQRRSPEKKIFPDCYECSAAFHVIYGEGYAQAALRELEEETSVSAPLTYLGKFYHRNLPENQVVAVFACRSDAAIRPDKGEASGADFYTKKQIDAIVKGKKTTPWLRHGWRIVRGKI